MKTLRRLLMPIERARALRSDERGQVVLLSGVMVFVIMIMTIVTFDMSKAVYRRIIAQNAVDSAADAAACWQARGCNLLQHLNNLHYEVNKALFVAEVGALVGCGLAPAALAAENAAKAFPPVWPAARAAYEITCAVCWFAPVIDWAQEKFATIVMAAQKIISKVFPALAFLYANVTAEQSGGDDVMATVITYAGDLLSKVGLSVGGEDSIFGAISEGLSGGMPVHIYAFPIDPTALSLHVEEKKGEGLPWKWDATGAKETYEMAGKPSCLAGVSIAFKVPAPKPEKWGWEDSYYWGNPGFMTWIAGKNGMPELIGLGKLRWLSGGKASDADMESYSRKLYVGDSMGGSKELRIPAFVAIASSQVEGEPVVAKGKADAKGHLITVQFPPDSSPTKGDKLLIYH